MPISAAANPINRLLSRSNAANFRVPRLPKLGELMRQGFGAGHAAFDLEAEQWRRDIERNIGEKLGDHTQQLQSILEQLAALQAGGATSEAMVSKIQDQVTQAISFISAPAPVLPPVVIPPPALPPSAKGSVALDSGVNGGSVTGLGLSFTPTVCVVTMRSPSTGLNLFANVVSATLTPDGFDFTLSGLTDSADYALDYVIN